jgi:hypothetical protein
MALGLHAACWTQLQTTTMTLCLSSCPRDVGLSVAAGRIVMVGLEVVQKVYPADWQRSEFLGQWIHALAAAAEEPFLTTGVKS